MRLAAGFAWTLLGCSSVPDVTFADGGADPFTSPDATADTLTSADASKRDDGDASKPVDAGATAYHCPDRPPPASAGVCCGARLCSKCTLPQCDRCGKAGCEAPSVCCAKNASTNGNSIACQSASTCS